VTNPAPTYHELDLEAVFIDNLPALNRCNSLIIAKIVTVVKNCFADKKFSLMHLLDGFFSGQSCAFMSTNIDNLSNIKIMLCQIKTF